MPKAMHRDTAVKLLAAGVATLLVVYALDALRPEPALDITPVQDRWPTPAPFTHVDPPSFERAGR